MTSDTVEACWIKEMISLSVVAGYHAVSAALVPRHPLLYDFMKISRSYNRLIACLKIGRIYQNGFGLIASQTSMRAHQFLKSRHLSKSVDRRGCSPGYRVHSKSYLHVADARMRLDRSSKGDSRLQNGLHSSDKLL